MKNLLTKLRYVPKHFGMAAAVLLATAGAAVTFAWGPERTTFTVEQPAPYVTFNSITNNPIDGDERNFVRIKDISTNNWTDDIVVEPGKEYKVRMLVHNNAADNLNLNALNTTVKAAVPGTTGKAVSVTGFVGADNAKPVQVWDEVNLTSAKDFNVYYVAGSARIYNQGYAVGGATLPDSIVTSAGAKVGYEAAGDGIIPGCFQYLSYVEFNIKPQFAPEQTSDFTMDKQVRKHSTTTGGWVETYTAQPGEVVDFIVRYKNTGSITQENVVVKDTLPTGMTYVAGSTIVANSNYPDGQAVADGVTTTGINIGAYAPGANAWVRFSAKVAASGELSTCGPNTLRNVASVETGAGTKTDDANVTVTKPCVDKDIKVCELSTKTIITINEKDLDAAKHSTNLDDCKVTPETPGTIASTGPGAMLGGLFGSSALGLGISSYIRSRAALRGALNQ